MKHKSINVLAEQNVMRALRNGPRATTAYNMWVIARDRKNGWVLMGGCGCLGVGEMWYKDEDYSEYPGYKKAPELESTPDSFGRKKW